MNPYVESLRPAWERPSYCYINWDKLEQCARSLANKKLELHHWRDKNFPREDSVILDFLFVLNAVNYCFTDFKTHKSYDVEYGGKIWHGAYACAAALRRALDEGMDILNPEFLKAGLTLGVCEHIFRSITTPIPLLQTRFLQLKHLGEDLLGNGFDTFTEVFENADFYVWREGKPSILSTLEDFRSYIDERKFKGRTVMFQKRAQLLPMMWHGRAMSSYGALTSIRDPEHLGPICEYRIAGGLRDLGILVYHEELAWFVDNRRLIGENSTLEVDLRSQCALAMVSLLEEANRFRVGEKPLTMPELDYYIFSLGRKSNKPHHYTSTTSY